MNDKVKIIEELLVLVLIAFPPFLYFYKYINDKVKSKLLKGLITFAYWVGTITISNLLPAIIVLFNIYVSRKEKNACRELDETSEKRRFKLDCSGWRFEFSLRKFITMSLWGILIGFLIRYSNAIVVLLLEKLGIPLENQIVINEFLKSGLWQEIFYFIIIVICAPIVEEFVFRFWIYDRILKQRINSVLAAIISSLLFMAAHFNIQGAAAFFLIGMINCYLYEKKGYFAAVANHFSFNLVTMVVLILVKAFNISI